MRTAIRQGLQHLASLVAPSPNRGPTDKKKMFCIATLLILQSRLLYQRQGLRLFPQSQSGYIWEKRWRQGQSDGISKGVGNVLKTDAEKAKAEAAKVDKPKLTPKLELTMISKAAAAAEAEKGPKNPPFHNSDELRKNHAEGRCKFGDECSLCHGKTIAKKVAAIPKPKTKKKLRQTKRPCVAACFVGMLAKASVASVFCTNPLQSGSLLHNITLPACPAIPPRCKFSGCIVPA